jgi:hypothetical protein
VVVPASSASAIGHEIARDPEVAGVAGPVRSRDGSKVLWLATPRHDGESPEAKALVARLRATLPAHTLVGGNSAGQVDFDHAV